MRTFQIELPDDSPRVSILKTLGAKEVAPGPKPPPYHIPGPYEIALAAGCALITRGVDAGAALQHGWAAVPEYFAGRDFYVNELAPARFGLATKVEGAADGTTAARV